MLPVIKVADIPLDARPIARRSANMVDESYVGGLWLPHDRAGALALDDPSTGQPRVGLIPADRAVLDRAAVAARRAFDSGWRGASVADRVAVLQALSDAIARQSVAFATAISAEMGAPIDYARAEHVKRSIGLIASVIDALQTTKTEQSPAGSRHDHHVLWEPCGVAALITPWNWPLNQMSRCL